MKTVRRRLHLLKHTSRRFSGVARNFQWGGLRDEAPKAPRSSAEGARIEAIKAPRG